MIIDLLSYPKMHDKTYWYQILIRLYDKGLLSGRELLRNMDIDYEQEIERMLQEQEAGQTKV